MEKRGVFGVLGEERGGGLDDFGVQKGGYFEGFPLMGGGFLGKIGRFPGEIREKGVFNVWSCSEDR